MGELWKCLPDGPDFLDLIFRWELALQIKIPRGKLEPVWCQRNEEFGTFARGVVGVLRGS